MDTPPQDSPPDKRLGWLTSLIIALYALSFFGLTAYYIAFASLSVHHSHTIAGQHTAERGAPTALRLGALDLSRARFAPRTDVQIDLLLPQSSRTLFRGAAGSHGLADANLSLPDDAPTGPARWRVTLHPPDKDPAAVEIPIHLEDPHDASLQDAWSDAATHVEEVSPQQPREKPDEGSGPVLLELLPEGGRAPDGLQATYFLRASERATGAPVRATVQLTLLKGLLEGAVPAELRTDEGGLAWFSATPTGNQRWRLTLSRPSPAPGAPPETSARELSTLSTSSQHALTVASPLWLPGEPLRAHAASLFRSGALYGDLYQGERWRFGRATGLGPDGAGFEFPPSAVSWPKKGLSLVRLQVYTDALQPGKAADTRALLLPAPGLDTRDALRLLLQHAADADLPSSPQARALLQSPWIEREDPARLLRHTSFWLSRLPRTLHTPELLEDTQPADTAQLASDKQHTRVLVSWLLGIQGALGLAWILYLVLANLLRVRREGRRVLQEIADEMASEGVHIDVQRSGLAHHEALPRLALLALTLGAALLGLIFLFRFL